MTPFEEHLKEALARKEPLQDFANRVLEKTKEQQPRRRTPGRAWWFRRPWAWRLAPVMAALVLVCAGVMYREHERTVRGELAKEKLLIAMRIAGSKLNDVRQHVIGIQYKEVEP
jgi:anti-sigma-K factor RskA